MEYTKCQSIYRNTLRALHETGVREGDPTLVVREIMESCRCDHVADLSELRKRLTARIGPERMERVLTPGADISGTDVRECDSALVHYGHWAHEEFVGALNFGNRVGYNLFDRWERTAAYFTAFAAGSGLAVSLRRQRIDNLVKNCANSTRTGSGAP
jgi:hypothetical protein